ncbi:rubredoxin [Candidatus Methanoperedens nitratireducens]
MAKFRCTVCNYIYDEGKKFSELPPNWVCPICSAPKSVLQNLISPARVRF